MFCIIGLGNPGDKYHNTRHNIGFSVIDKLANDHNASLKYSEKHHCEYASFTFNNEKVFLLKPMTFMNRSGIPVSSFCSFYKIELSNIFVIHDDLDLQKCRVKIKNGGGSGGHNGLKSLDQHIGNSYNRIRIGIGRPLYKEQVTSWVLHKFPQEDIEKFDILIDNFLLHFKELTTYKIDNFVRHLNQPNNN